jgi:hypothetical protein
MSQLLFEICQTRITREVEIDGKPSISRQVKGQ